MQCKYCGSNIEHLVHMRWCDKNPGRVLAKEKTFVSKEELHKILSASRKKWLKENPEKHPWKSHKKFKSVPCEKLKTILLEKGFIFSPEYEPLEDRFFAIDIAFVENKIAIEVNGNQHYTDKGELLPYYKERHDRLVSEDWQVLEIPYRYVYNKDYINKLCEHLSGNLPMEELEHCKGTTSSLSLWNKLRAEQTNKLIIDCGVSPYSCKDWVKQISNLTNLHPNTIRRRCKGLKPTKRKPSTTLKGYLNLQDYRNSMVNNNTIIRKKRQELILSSSIDFSSYGWGTKLAKELRISPQKTVAWVKKWMPDFYKFRCYKNQ